MNDRRQAETAQLADALRGAVGRFVRAVRSRSGTATTAQSEVLAQLARDGPATVAALATLRGVTHQTMRLIVARLVDQGLLSILPNPADRRSQLVAPTRQGLDKIKRQQAARTDHLANLLATRLSDEERQVLGQAIGLLDRLSSDE